MKVLKFLFLLLLLSGVSCFNWTEPYLKLSQIALDTRVTFDSKSTSLSIPEKDKMADNFELGSLIYEGGKGGLDHYFVNNEKHP